MNVRFLKAMVLMAFLTIADPLVADEFRTWKSENRKHSVNAKFENFDAGSNQVTLIDRDGREITVQLGQLSSSDQKYVVRQQKRLDAEKNEADNPFKVVADETEKKKRRWGRTKPPTVSRFGIEWTPGLGNAQVAALGSRRQTKDDRPIMWFRVLGNLEGFM